MYVLSQNNRWSKKGLTVVAVNYRMEMMGSYGATVSIYQGDGTVAVHHSGVEMGQGINTKVAQACAWALGIDLEKVVVKPTNEQLSVNTILTGGSVTSEAVCLVRKHS